MILRRLTIFLLLSLFGAVGLLFFIRGEIHKYDSRIVTRVGELETAGWQRPRVAIVFGASVLGNRSLSPILADRVERAIELYRAGKVDRILVSGDNRHHTYNEPGAMQDYLVARMVPRDHIIVDSSGRSTYETCLRARDVFGLSQAVLVSQGFHLPRALFIANELGLSAVGVAGNLQLASSFGYQNIREVVAELKAWFNIRVSPPADLSNRAETGRLSGLSS
ncbi:MAG: SanA protein [Acidobacteria bacterium]|nr:SanA protein [Acidobacteriota bacterium]